MDKKRPMRGLYRNAVSYFGGMVIIISLVLILLKKGVTQNHLANILVSRPRSR